MVWKPRDPRYNTKGKVLKVNQRDLRHANMNAFGSALENYDWHQILYGGEIDEKVNRFISIVNSRVEKFFRKVKVEGTVKINRLLRTKLNH